MSFSEEDKAKINQKSDSVLDSKEESYQNQKELDNFLDLLAELAIISPIKNHADDTKISNKHEQQIDEGLPKSNIDESPISESSEILDQEEVVDQEKTPELTSIEDSLISLISEQQRDEGLPNSNIDESPILEFGNILDQEEVVEPEKTPELTSIEDSLISLVSKIEDIQASSQENTEEIVSSNNNLIKKVDYVPNQTTLSTTEENISTNHSTLDYFLDRNLANQAINKSEELNNLVELLEDILVDSDDPESRELIKQVQQRLSQLDREIHEPTEMLNLLLPLMAKLINLTVAQSRDSVTNSLAPIIDEIIQHRNKQDRISMGAAIAPALPSAIARQILDSPSEMANALAPEIATAIKEQIRLERDAMVDALYPVIGNTIYTYLAEEIRAINEKVERALSFEGIGRKFRSKVQGVSEAELILKEAMRFVVRAVFLIDKGSGLIISEVQPSQEQRLESEMVAGMLTAIRSFANDCIAQTGDVSELDAIDYGNSQIVLEVAGYCYLAVVVQGEIPQWFSHEIRESLSSIVQNHGESIESFEGDPTTIPEPVHQTLAELIYKSQSPIPTKTKRPPALLLVSLAVLGLIFLPLGIHWYQTRNIRTLKAETELALASAPELSVYRIKVEAKGDSLTLSGRVPNQYLHQKAEQIAQTVAPNQQLENKIIAVDVPPDPVLAEAEVKRIEKTLNDLEGITIAGNYQEGTVQVRGTVATSEQADRVTEAMGRIPGVRYVTNTVEVKQLRISTRIYFAPGSATLSAANANREIIIIKEFLQRFKGVNLKITGHTDARGQLRENQRLARKRAITVRDALVKEGIAPERLEISGTTQLPPDVTANQPLWLSRCVRFEPFIPVEQK
ncbi:MAG: BON domain-containing protein [Coleofasciculaceae cyanobacterium]